MHKPVLLSALVLQTAAFAQSAVYPSSEAGAGQAAVVQKSGTGSSRIVTINGTTIDASAVGALPLAGGTASGPLKAPQIAYTLYADSFPGADPSARINACEVQAHTNADAVDGYSNGLSDKSGVGAPQRIAIRCDASMYTGFWNMASQIDVLPKTVLLLPHYARWAWCLTDGVSVGIRQHGASTIEGTAVGGGGGQMILQPSCNNANMEALYATMPPTSNANGDYYLVSGLSAQNTGPSSGKFQGYPGARFSHGLVYFTGGFDEFNADRVGAFNDYGDSMHIADTCCSSVFTNMQASGSIRTGGTPLTFEDGNHFIYLDAAGHQVDTSDTAPTRHIVNGATYTSYAQGGSNMSWSGTANAAGPGKHNVWVQPNNYELNFPNLYVESDNSTDTKTAAIGVDAGAGSVVNLMGGSYNPSDRSKPCFATNPAATLVETNWCYAGVSYQSNLRVQRYGFGDPNRNYVSTENFDGSNYPQNGQVGAGHIRFTPAKAGWYDLFAKAHGDTAGVLAGSFDISVAPSSGSSESLLGFVQTNLYSGPSSITVMTGSQYYAAMPVDELATWMDTGNVIHFAVHVQTAGIPLLVNLFGQQIDPTGIIASPVLSAAPDPTRGSYAALTSLQKHGRAGAAVQTTGAVFAGKGILLQDTNGNTYLYKSSNGQLVGTQQPK